MKKYKVEGNDLEELLRKVSIKLNVKKEDVKYNILQEDKKTKKIALEVWVETHEEQLVKQQSQEEKRSTNPDERVNQLETMIRLDVTKEGVYLLVKHGDIDFNELINFIAQKDIESPDVNAIMEAYSKRDEKLQIAEYYEGIYKETQIDISITDDKMQAAIYLTEPRGVNLPGTKDIINKLNEKGVVFGIKEEVISEVLANKKFNQEVSVAYGEESKDGKDGYIKYNIKTIDRKDGFRPSVLEDGSVDFQNMDLIENVAEGYVLAERIKAEKGTPGKNVLGQDTPVKDGKEAVLPAGKNTEPSHENPDLLISKINGMVSIKDKKVHILDVLMLQDVGLSTGNIKFSGSVVVQKDVSPDYTIESEGDIEVKGNVEKAILKAQGNVIVKRSFFGSGAGVIKGIGKIETKADAIINFGESVIIEAEGNVVVNEAIMNCQIYAGKKVILADKKGSIMGGNIVSGDGIEAINIGSALGAKTDLEVGSNPHLIQRMKFIEGETETLTKKMDQIEKNLNILQKLKVSLKENMPKDKEEILGQLIKAKFATTKYLNDMKKELEELNIKMNDAKRATVDVSGTCYSGVKIKIRKATYFVQENIKNVRFYYNEEDASIKITSLK